MNTVLIFPPPSAPTPKCRRPGQRQCGAARPPA